MSLKTQIISDLGFIINSSEFADTITIDGVEVDAVVVIDDLTAEFISDAKQGRVYVPVSSLPAQPTYRSEVIIDGETWYVFRDKNDRECYVSDGLYVLSITSQERAKVF